MNVIGTDIIVFNVLSKCSHQESTVSRCPTLAQTAARAQGEITSRKKQLLYPDFLCGFEGSHKQNHLQLEHTVSTCSCYFSIHCVLYDLIMTLRAMFLQVSESPLSDCEASAYVQYL